MHPIDRLVRLALPVAATALLVTGCAATNIQAQWTDPQFANHSLQGANVLVRCEARETALRQICVQQVSEQVRAAGALPVAAAADGSAGDTTASDDALAAARTLGARAVLTSRIAPGAAVAAPRPQVGFGVGSWGGSVGTSVGVSVPVGGQRVNTAYTADMALTDVASGKLMWSGTLSAPASSNVNAQLADLAKSGVEAAKKAGVF
jgi:hypothetical protein